MGCLTRVFDLRRGLVPVARLEGAQGSLIGITADSVITWEQCFGFPCAVQSWSLATGAGRRSLPRPSPPRVTRERPLPRGGHRLRAEWLAPRRPRDRRRQGPPRHEPQRAPRRRRRPRAPGHRGPGRRGRARRATAPSPIPSAPPARRCCRERTNRRLVVAAARSDRRRPSPPAPSGDRRPSPTARIRCSAAGRAGTRTRSSATSGHPAGVPPAWAAAEIDAAAEDVDTEPELARRHVPARLRRRQPDLLRPRGPLLQLRHRLHEPHRRAQLVRRVCGSGPMAGSSTGAR